MFVNVFQFKIQYNQKTENPIHPIAYSDILILFQLKWSENDSQRY